MKYLPLVWSGLWRKPARTILTLISVVVAFSLYGIVDGVTAAFDHAIDRLTDAAELRTMSRINFAAGLPLAYRARIESVPGVREVGVVNFFAGYFQDPRNNINAAAIDANHLHAMADVTLADEQLEAMTLYCCQSEPLLEMPYTAYVASFDGANALSCTVPSADHAFGSSKTSDAPSSPFCMYTTLWFWSPEFLLKKKYGPLCEGAVYLA